MVRFGILGAGRIANTLAGTMNFTEGVEITAIGSRDIDKARQFAEKHNIKKAYGSYEELCADNDVDIVYVATPHGRHFTDAMTALTHGKGVLCEKAFTLNSYEAETLITYAREHDLFLCEAMWPRFFPVTKKVKQWLGEKRIGDVKVVEADMGFYAGNDFTGSRLLNLESGGGALLDVGIYDLAFASFAYGSETPKSVKASGKLFNNGADAVTSAIIEYETGNAVISCSLETSLPCQATIYGSKGKIEIYDAFIAPNKAKLCIYKDKEQNEEYSSPLEYNGYEYEIRSVAQSFEAGLKECSEIPLDETLTIMHTVDRIKAEIGLVYPQDK